MFRMPLPKLLALFSVALAESGCASVADRPVAALAVPEHVPMLEVSETIHAPTLDASPDDAAWNGAAVIAEMTSSLGTPAALGGPLPTRVLLLWDQNYLYVRFICSDDEIYVPFEGTARDKPYYRGDAVEVFLDPKGDGRQYFELQVTPANQLLDQTLLVTADRVTSDEHGRLTKDILERDLWPALSYDMPGLRTAAGRSSDGKQWIVDIAIPAEAALKRLGMKHFEPMTLRANLLRYDWPARTADVKGQRQLNPMNWAAVEFGRPHQSPAAMGVLRLVSNAAARQQ